MTERFETRELWFPSDGAQLFAIESGHGRPLVLLHGGLATHAAVRLFADPLSACFRIITPDLRGSGRSTFADPLTWDQLADDVAALLRHLELPTAAIGGISFGAGCAVRTALRHPQLVSSLLVLHPAYGGAELGLSPAQQAAMTAMNAAGSRTIAEGIEVLLPLFDALPDSIRARARALVATYDPASVATSTRFMASGAQPFERGADLAAITAPTLVVPGIDPTHPSDVADVYRDHLHDCHVRDAGPAELATAIAAFLDETRAVP